MSAKAAYMKDYRERNPEYRERNNRRSRERIERLRPIAQEIIREAKRVPCAECGKGFHYAAMQFDHVRGEKTFTIANYTQGRYLTNDMGNLRDEIAKCDVVCANCHSVRTWTRKWGIDG